MKYSKIAMGIAPSLTLGVNNLAKELKAQGKDVVNFGVGEPDFDTPDYIKNAAKDALDKGMTKYTAVPGIPELKAAIAERYENKYGLKYDPASVVVSTGAKQALFNSIITTIDPGDEVIIFAPYWVTYPELVKMAGGIPVIVEGKEEDNFIPDLSKVEEKITDRTQMIILTNPSNPCGIIYGMDYLTKLAEIAKAHDLYIISDEIYDELCFEGEMHSIAQVSEDAKQRTIIVNGVSKSFAMTGWRMGYTICEPKLAKYMSSYQSHSTSNCSSITQYASLAAFRGPKDDMRNMVEKFKERSELIYRLVCETDGVSCQKPQGAFYILLNVASAFGKKYKGEVIENSNSFAESLLKSKYVAVVPGIAFGAEGYVRISYATSEDLIIKGLERIKEYMSELE